MTPRTPPRGRGVTVAARDEVAVEVHDGLACRLAAIHPNIVAVGRRRVVLSVKLSPTKPQAMPPLLNWLRLHNPHA